MNHSSRGNPCPLCGREKDDKCRFSDNFIFCYRGDSYSPPDLRVGQTIELPGWPTMAVVRLDGGFAGCSAVLAPHDGRAWLQGSGGPSPAERLAVRLRVGKSISEIRGNLRSIRACAEFEYLTIEELRHWRSLAVLTWESSVELYELVRSGSLYLDNRAQMLLLIKDSIKHLGYFSKSINYFFSHQLNDFDI